MRCAGTSTIGSAGSVSNGFGSRCGRSTTTTVPGRRWKDRPHKSLPSRRAPCRSDRMCQVSWQRLVEKRARVPGRRVMTL
ncbi:hypothetical protein ACQP15_26100 [Microbispora siamensis]